MRKWKYVISALILVGITLFFLFLLDCYKEVGYTEEKDIEITDLNLVSAKETYTSVEIAQILVSNEYKYFDEQKNSKSDEELLDEATNNINAMLDSIEDKSICKDIERKLKNGLMLEIATYRQVGHIEDEVIVFNLVSIWTDDVYVIYEEETGVIALLEYYVRSDDKDGGELEDRKDIKEIHNMICAAAQKYCEKLGQTKEQLTDGIYDINGEDWVISLTLKENTGSDAIIDEKPYGEAEGQN